MTAKEKTTVGIAVVVLAAAIIRVFAVMHGVGEAEFARSSAELATANQPLSAREIERLVERIRDPADLEAFARLQAAGESAVPAVVRAMSDRRYFVLEAGSSGLPTSPFARLLLLASPYRPRGAVKYIAPLVRESERHFRAEAAFALGNIGSDECIAPLKVSLADSDQHVRSMGLIGIKHCLGDDACSAAFRKEIFDALKAIVTNPNEKNDEVFEYAPRVLLDVDSIRGSRALTAEDVLTREKFGLPGILAAINEYGVELPAGRLLALLSSLRAGVDDDSQSCSYGEALIALARIDSAAAEPMVQEAIAWRKANVSERAAAALCAIRGLPDPWGRVSRIADEAGIGVLTAQQRHYLAVGWLKDEVDSGGFLQYFRSPSGRTAKDALEGLRAMKADKTAAIFESALAIFGAEGLFYNDVERAEQIDQLSAKQIKLLGALEDEFGQDADDLQLTMLLYVADHVGDF